MDNFINTYSSTIIYTIILLIVILIVRYILRVAINKIGRSSNINEARIGLIKRYVAFALILIGILVESFILGAKAHDLAVVFSSVFAVIGIALFAIWSILSNITSGVIMFFSFPYKVGDKIQIHDKDFPIEAIIEDIRAFQVYLRQDNGDLVTYPNNLLLQKAVTLIKKDAIDDGSETV